MLEKARFLYNSYIGHSKQVIDECGRITWPKLKFSKSNRNLSPVRQQVVSYLKEWPVNTWVSFDQLSRELRKGCIHLFNDVRHVLIRDDYYKQYYNTPNWTQFEHCAINIIIMEYLATFGAVYVLAAPASRSDYDYIGSEAFEACFFV